MIIPEHMIQSNPVVLIREEVDPVGLCSTFIAEYNTQTQKIEEIRGLCNHVVDNTFHFTQVRNDLEMPIAIGRHIDSIGSIEPYDEEMCFEADPECESLAALQMQELEIKDEGKISSRKPLQINEHKYNNGVRAYALSRGQELKWNGPLALHHLDFWYSSPSVQTKQAV
jgi:hypothetical protein